MFKKQTGESFIQYVTRVKMEKAIELLRDPQYKTYQVSEILGYKTPRYFSRLFRTHTGMNPSEYRGKVLHLGGVYDEA
jgi:YesN/AraC family two-component response regulator